MANTRHLSLSDITIDPTLQMRVKMSEDAIDEYAENIDKIPPPRVVMDDDGHYYLIDWHRFSSYQKAGKEKAPFEVIKGTWTDALHLAAGSNSDHGVRRTPDDKRKAVETLLSVNGYHEMSDHALAEICKVSHPFVARVRATFKPNAKPTGNVSSGDSPESDKPPPKRTGKDGVARPASKPKADPKTFVMCQRCTNCGKPSCDKCRAKNLSGLTPKPKPTNLAPPAPEVNGKPLPKSVANALADTWHAESARLLSKMRVEAKSAFSWSVFLDAEVLNHLKAAEDCFLTATPKKPCTDCHGQKKINGEPCLTCRNSGYLASHS